MIEDYSDQPGHRGVSGDEYGFPEDVVTRAIQQGFQVGVHAIGDQGAGAMTIVTATVCCTWVYGVGV